MSQAEALFQRIAVSPEAQHTISKVLSRVEPSVLNTWMEKLQVKEGRIIGTFYSELGAQLSYSDFGALYQALGYDFGQLAYWQDWWCYGAEGCKRQSGYTCDPNRCP